MTALVAAAVALAAASGCGGADDVAARPAVTVPAEVVATRTFPPAVPAAPLTFEAPPPPMTSGNPDGTALVPAEAQAVDTSQPTLSGGGERRILYMNTCDEAQGWTTSHCQDQDHPQLVVQNLTFADGNSTGELTEGGGGGAIFVRGGRFRVVSSVFLRNRCDPTGPDLGGAAIRVLSQYQNLPVYVVNSTFGGAPGEGGGCSNDGTGTLTIESSTLQRNPSGQFQTQPGIFFMGSGGAPSTPGSTVR